MSVKRKRRDAGSVDEESTEPACKVTKQHDEILQGDVTLPGASLKLPRPNKRTRKALLKLQQAPEFSSKPLSKGEELINLIRKRKVENRELKSKDCDPPPYQTDYNGVNGTTDDMAAADENFVKLQKTPKPVKKSKPDELESHAQDNLPFDAKSFRKSLGGSQKFAALRGFVRRLNRWRSGEGEDVAGLYLESGGSPLEILNVLQTKDTSDLSQAELVFKTVNILFMRGLTDTPASKPSCEEACRHILNAYLPIVRKMIAVNASGQERKVALKLLTSIVSMNSLFAGDVLTSIRFPQPLQKCLAQTIDPRDQQSVRTCFIHFLMAFLVEENIDLIKPLLEIQGLLSSIIPGLIYDRAPTVFLVLTTLRTRVVENRAVNKTQKLFIFNTGMINTLIRLYEWKGPQNFHKIKSATSARHDSAKVDESDKCVVVEALDLLMTVLCTSHKLGVVFLDRSLGTSGNRLNELMWKVLMALERPWERDSIRALVVRVLAACPDLVSGQMKYVAQFLEPRPSPNYEQAVCYVRQVLESLPVDVMVPHLAALKGPQLKSAVQTMCAPSTVLDAVCTSASVLHEELAVRHTALSLISAMLRQVEKFILALTECESLANKAKVSRLKYNLTWLFPSGKLLLQSWDLSTVKPSVDASSDAHDPTPSVSEHLLLLLELLGLYLRVCPNKLEADDRSKLSFQHLSAGITRIEADNEATEMDLVRVNAIQVAMAVDATAFQADKATFYSSLLLLLRYHGSGSTTASASRVLTTVLTSVLTATGLFQRSPGEIDIWLHSIRTQPLELHGCIVKLLAKSIVKAMKHPDRFTKIIASAEKPVKKEEVEEEPSAVKNDEPVNEGKHLSPLLPCILAYIKDTDCDSKEFLNTVAVHLFHWLEEPDVLACVVTGSQVMHFDVSQYIGSWLDVEKTPTVLAAPFNDTPEHKISLAILSGGEVADGSGKQKAFEFSYLMQLDDLVHLRLLFNLTLFHLAQMIVRNELTETSSKTCEAVLKTLLQAQKEHEDATGGSNDERFESLFGNRTLLQSFDPFDDKNKVNGLATKLIVSMTRWIRSTSCCPKNRFNTLLKPYKDRLIDSIEADLTLSQTERSKHELTEEKSKKLGLLEIVEIFELDFSKINTLISQLTSMPFRLFITSSCKMSGWGVLVAFLLKRITSLHLEDRSQSAALDAQQVNLLSRLITLLHSRKAGNAFALEETFLAYLRQFPRSLKGIGHTFFLRLLKTENPTQTTVDTAVFLLARDPSLKKLFIKDTSALSAELQQQRSYLLVSLLSVLISAKSEMPSDFVSKLYERFEKDLIKGLTRPKKADVRLKENTSTALFMIDNCMSNATRATVCADIQEHTSKHYNCRPSHIQLIERIFSPTTSCELTLVLLQIMTNSTSTINLDLICNVILKQTKQSCDWETLKTKNAIWPQFTVHALKLGLKPALGNYSSALLLETLSTLCQLVYTAEEQHADIVRLFQMTSSHSEFLNVMLGWTPTKLRLVELLKTLVDKNKSVIAAAQVPVLLGAYNATLSLADQSILQLLKTYETNGVSLHECRPYLWGKAAINHFCITSKKTSSLWRQPSAGQVLDLIQTNIMKETIAKFPLNRKLNLETCVGEPNVYDPSFFLPLFSQLLSSDSVVKCYKFIQSGCLALTLASLASNSRAIRAAAYHVIYRFYFHLDGVRGPRDKAWWFQFLDAIRNGVVDLEDEKCGPQLACIVSTFLARASLHISRPLDPMFAPLTKFIVAKPAMNLNMIPELYLLFHSTELQSQLYRHWLLEVIRDGMRLTYDWNLCLSALFFKLMCVFYSSVIGSQDTKSKVLILSIINNAVKLPGIAQQLATGSGLFPWLHETARHLKKHNEDLVIGAARIAVSLWAVKNAKRVEKVAQSQNVNMSSYQLNVSLLLVALIPVLPKTVPVSELKQYVAAIEESVATKNEVINLQHVTTLATFVKETVGNIGDCEDLLEFGSAFATKDDVCCVDDAEAVKQSLRNTIIALSEGKKEVRLSSTHPAQKGAKRSDTKAAENGTEAAQHACKQE